MVSKDERWESVAQPKDSLIAVYAIEYWCKHFDCEVICGAC